MIWVRQVIYGPNKNRENAGIFTCQAPLAAKFAVTPAQTNTYVPKIVGRFTPPNPVKFSQQSGTRKDPAQRLGLGL